MFWKKKRRGRIFISYRRSDTQGYAGRLSDSLETYFGGKRVFRDIEDIEGGSEYAKDIQQQLGSADAVILLMGPNWLSVTNDDGKRRIDDPDDWVAQEIVTAIEQGIRVFPVLIEGTILPRKDELPAKLVPILNYNAVTISDSNWDVDVLRLGKIISFDIPTTNERILFWIQVSVYSLLSGSLIISAAIISRCAISGECRNSENTYELISKPAASIPFYAVIFSLIILSLILGLVAKEKQKYIIYSIISGLIGTAYFFFGFLYFREEYSLMKESMFVYFGSVLVSTIMFIFLGLSGFKPK